MAAAVGGVSQRTTRPAAVMMRAAFGARRSLSIGPQATLTLTLTVTLTVTVTVTLTLTLTLALTP